MHVIDEAARTVTPLPAHQGVWLTTFPASQGFWATRGVAEACSMRWCLNAYGDASATALDIGANVGTWTVPMSRAFKAVVAFEPMRPVFHNLCANLALQGASNVWAVETALSEGPARCAEYVDRTGYDPGSVDWGNCGIEPLGAFDVGRPRLPVPCVPLDNWVEAHEGQLGLDAAPLRFLKIDVEGHELSVLRGAARTIQRFRPVLALESWRADKDELGIPARALRRALFDYLAELEYDVAPMPGHDEMFVCTSLVRPPGRCPGCGMPTSSMPDCYC
jgi:FkbM family methyltransferase